MAEKIIVKKVLVGTPLRRVTAGAFAITNLGGVDVSATESDGSILAYNKITQKYEVTNLKTDANLTSLFDSELNKYTFGLTNTAFTGSIIPDSNEAYDLGSSTKKWRDLYLSGNTITLGTLSLKDSGGSLTVVDASGNKIDLDLSLSTNNASVLSLDSESGTFIFNDSDLARTNVNEIFHTGLTVNGGLSVTGGATIDSATIANLAGTNFTGSQATLDSATIGGIHLTTNDITTTGKLYYSNVFSALSDLPDASTYHGMFAHVHATGKGYFAHGGAWHQLLDKSSANDSATITNLATAQLDAGQATIDSANITSISFSSIDATTTSTIRNIFSAAGDLSYNSGTGEFTFDVESVYTKANFDSDLGLANTGQLPEGTNLYYTTARFDAALATKTTADLAEHNTNLYYTTARADSDAKASLLVNDTGGDGSLTYDSASGVFTYTGPSAAEVRAHLTANKGLSVSSGEFNIDSANVKGMFSAGGDLLYNSSTGEFSLERPEIDSAGVRALVSVTDAGGDGSLSYNNGTGVFTYTGPSASEVRAHLTANKGLAVSNGEFNIDSANVRAMVSVTDAGGDGSLSYNASTGVLTYTGPSASEAQSHLTANKGLSVSSGEFNIDSDNVKGMFSATDAGGDGSFSYSNGVYTYTGPSAAEVRAHLTANKGLSVSSGVFNIDSANVRGMFSVSGDLAYNSGTGAFSFTERTDAEVRGLVSATDAGGDGSFSYNSSTGVYTYTGPSASEVRAHLTANKGLSVSSGEFNIDSSNVRGMFSATDAGGDGSFAYNSSNGTYTYTGPSATEVRAHLTANKGLSVSSGEFNIDSANVKAMFSGSTGVTYSNGAISIGQAVATSDDVTFADIAATGNVVISGNLQILGSQTDVATTTLTVTDKNITIADSSTSSALTDGAGLTFGAWSSGTIPTFTWNHANTRFASNYPIAANIVGNVTGTTSDISNHTTADLTENTNLYHTTARARGAVSVTDAGGDGSASYNSSTGVITYTGPSASEVRAHLTANKGLSVSSGEFNIDSDNVKGMFAGNKGLSYSDGTFNIDSANVRAMLSGGTGITYNSGTGAITTTDGDIVHDNLSGFVANEHIDHTSVSVTAGRGLTGGGTIAATRTVAIDSAELLAYFESSLRHDNLSGFVANEHIDHTGVTLTAGDGLTGGGTIAASRTFTVVGGKGIIANADDIQVDSANIKGMFSGGTGITYSNGAISTTDGDIVHDNLSGFVANEHIDHSAVSVLAGTGLSGGGTIAADRTVAIDSAELLAYFEPSLRHDNLSGFVANEHIDHSGVSITAGTGLTGGGTIAATRTVAIDSSGLNSYFGGTGKGFDADKLDGQHGTHYRINVYNNSGTLLN
jgi:hypothetical protein